MNVRTRIAPSPTGIPHIGTARTALFDYLLAKKYGGEFILRLEDTDQKRYVPKATEVIYELHHFLGLIPDESPEIGGKYGPYIQTERLDIYQKYAKKLVKQGTAYEDDGAIRIKMPDTGRSNWHDMIQGKLSYPYEEVDDKVLMKSNGIPTYHFAVVVDDHLMKISHVLRGVEWISSTPVHLLLYEAFGWEPPLIGHFPLILGPDRSKLSKRHGAKSVLEFRDEGYLPQAINNFLFYLGHSYQDNSAILTLEEMIQVFNESKLQKQNGIFDIKKLDYFNSQWIKRLEDEELLKYLTPFVTHHVTKDILLKIIPLVKGRITTLKEFSGLTEFFFKRPDPVAELVDKKEYLESAINVLKTCDWSKVGIEEELVKMVEKKGFNKSDFFMTLRLAVCASRVTPPLTESMLILGRDEVYARLREAFLLK